MAYQNQYQSNIQYIAVANDCKKNNAITLVSKEGAFAIYTLCNSAQVLFFTDSSKHFKTVFSYVNFSSFWYSGKRVTNDKQKNLTIYHKTKSLWTGSP